MWHARFFVLCLLLLILVSTRAGAQPAAQPARGVDLLVVDRDTGVPLEMVKVSVDSESGDANLATGPDGHVTLPLSGNPNGHFNAVIDHDGYVKKLLEWNQREPAPEKYTLKLEPGTTIGGKVIDDAGTPIAGASVVVSTSSAAPAVGTPERNHVSFETVKTGADGMWTFKRAPREFDTAHLGVWDYRYVCEDFYTLQKFPADKAKERSIALTLQRGVAVEGTVLDPNGKPVNGAEVRWGGTMGSNTVPAFKTKEDGRFAYTAKPGQQVTLRVTASGFAPEVSTFKMSDEKHDQPITLQAPKAIFGRIVGPDGEAVPNAWVYSVSVGGKQSLDTRIQSGKEGKFRWNDAPLDPVTCDIDGTSAGYARETMELTADDKEIVVTLRKALKVSGTVVNEETGKPIDGFTIVPGIEWGKGIDFRIIWERYREIKNGKEGKFEYSETSGRTPLAVRIEADGYLPEERQGFTLDDKAVTIEFKLKPTENIVVTVHKPDGTPAAKVKGYLVVGRQTLLIHKGEVSNQSSPEATTDAAGKLTFPPQAEPFLFLVACSEGYAQVHQTALGDGAVTLHAWGKLEGSLTLDEKPASGETISVAQKGGMPPQQNVPKVYFSLGATTDSEGKFTVDRIPPGAIAVSRTVQERLSDTAFQARPSLTQNVTISAGETAKVRLEGTKDAKK